MITGDYIRKQVKLAKLAEEFYQMWLVDDRFALYGTCLFPTQGRPITHIGNITSHGLLYSLIFVLLNFYCGFSGRKYSLSETLLKRINDNGHVYMIPAKLRDMYVIDRFAVCSRYTELSDIQASCQEIHRHSSNVVKE